MTSPLTVRSVRKCDNTHAHIYIYTHTYERDVKGLKLYASNTRTVYRHVCILYTIYYLSYTFKRYFLTIYSIYVLRIHGSGRNLYRYNRTYLGVNYILDYKTKLLLLLYQPCFSRYYIDQNRFPLENTII